MSIKITPELLKSLPEEVAEQLRLGTRTKGPSTADKLYPLVGSEEPVDLNQLIVAVWQEHQEVLRRTTAMAALNTLRSRGLVRRCGRGSYIRGAESSVESA